MVMVGEEVIPIATMVGAVVGRWDGEATTVRRVTGRKAGANPILTVPLGWQEGRREA